MKGKRHPRTSWIKIEWCPHTKDYIASSSVNPNLKVFGSTRHRALSAIERDMPRYLRWVKEIDARIGRRRVA